MTKNQANIRILLFTFYFLLFTFILGCAAVQEYREPSEGSNGQITIFLNGPDKTSLDITFELLAVNIMAEDGTYRELVNTPLNINSFAITGRQMLLCERTLPEVRYKKLQFIVKQASIKRKDKIASLALPPEGLELDIDIAVSKNQNTSLFLNWQVEASIVDGYLFSPVFAVKGQVPELSALLIYVTNEGSNNVSVINRQSGKVVATIMVGRKPRGIAASLGRERPKVYVANSGSNSISVIDPTTNKVENEIPIRFGREPEGIAAARISSEKEFIFVTNYGSNTVSVVDASTQQELEKINVGNGPVAAAVDPYFNIYIVNKISNDVSVLRWDVPTKGFKKFIDVRVEWSPMALAVDYPKGKVYVANYGFSDLSIIDINTMAIGAITNVGTSIIGVLPDPTFDRIYLLKEVPGEIMIIRPPQEYETLRTVMTHILGTIPVGSSPRALISDPEGRKLYVVNRGSDTVSVIDKTTKREEQVIPVGKRPYGLAMFPF
jgi:YVTN family beta-propeller protein